MQFGGSSIRTAQRYESDSGTINSLVIVTFRPYHETNDYLVELLETCIFHSLQYRML